jgi:hypothetical protein
MILSDDPASDEIKTSTFTLSDDMRTLTPLDSAKVGASSNWSYMSATIGSDPIIHSSDNTTQKNWSSLLKRTKGGVKEVLASSELGMEQVIKIIVTDNDVYIQSSGQVPIITLISYTKSKISDEPGMTLSTVVFRSDVALEQWEARAGGFANGQGLLVGSGLTAEPNTDISFDVECSELTEGDKLYRINIYGKNAQGWNAYE